MKYVYKNIFILDDSVWNESFTWNSGRVMAVGSLTEHGGNQAESDENWTETVGNRPNLIDRNVGPHASGLK